MAYKMGVRGCTLASNGAMVPDVLQAIANEGGFTTPGAAGVYRSAVETLCPQFQGFKSDFDRSVDTFRSQSDVQWSSGPPPAEDFGWFLKAEHQGFHQGIEDAPTMVNWLHQQPNVRLANAYGVTDDVLWRWVMSYSSYWPWG